MSMERYILRLLLAAIVMVAAQFLPSAAGAHDGHGRHAIHEASPAPSVDPSAVTSRDAASIRPSAGSSVMAEGHGPACAPGCLACAGGGTACCCGGAMILPATADLPQRGVRPAAVTVRDVPTPAGIGLEALPEPPRPTA